MVFVVVVVVVVVVVAVVFATDKVCAWDVGNPEGV